LPRAGIIDPNRDPGDRIDNCTGGLLDIEPIHQVPDSDDETRCSRHSPPSGKEPQQHQIDEHTQPLVADVARGLSCDREP
jgi:hypothetical protein